MRTSPSGASSYLAAQPSGSTTSAAAGVRPPRGGHISSPERAILEALDELPDHESFHNLDATFESLTTLRPRKLNALLAECTSVKVKRLFFVFADRHAHTWRKHIQPEAINLGKGDRALVQGGKLHPDYRITVPAEYAAPREEAGRGP